MAVKNPLMKMHQQLDILLADFFTVHHVTGKHLCVGLSGGVDSVVLLHAMHRFRQNNAEQFHLSAVHVHHGLSARADDWADFCICLCQSYDVPCEMIRVCVPRSSGEGLEAAARRQRYSVFETVEADGLLLAHHRGDQAETVLLNLLRGAGVAGAAGMHHERPQSRGATLLRPLLEATRSQIENYAAEHGLRWVEDDSNDNRHFRRNFLRHDILPELEEKFHGAEKSLARAAGHFAEAARLLEDLAALDKAAVVAPSGRLRLSLLNTLPPARARNLLRYAWSVAGFRAPDARWINEALKQLATADPLSEICLTTSDGELYAYRGELHLVPLRPLLPTEPVIWSGQEALSWGEGIVRFRRTTGQGIRRHLFEEGAVRLMPRQGGERLQPGAKRPRRSLRNLLQEAAVPPWERSRLPLLWMGDRLAWVGGIGYDMSFVCSQGEEGLLVEWEVV